MVSSLAYYLYSEDDSNRSPTDPLAIALTGNDVTLLPMLCRAMIGGLVLAPGVGEAYAATDENDVLVGYLAFSLPDKLLFST